MTRFQWVTISILLLPLLGATLNGLLALSGRRLGFHSPKKLTTTIALLASFGSFTLTFLLFLGTVLTVGALEWGPPLSTGSLFTWMPGSLFSVQIGFTLNALNITLMLLITGIGSLIHLYSTGYMAEDPAYDRYFSYLNLFLFFMLLLVMADNLLVLFIGWEGVGLCSYLLIGFWFTDLAKAEAGKKAFIVNRIGDLGFLIGIFLILYAVSGVKIPTDGNPLHFDALLSLRGALAPFAPWIALSLFIGATGKSAQIPLYIWLPDAMAGPTPVSALIHAATMVTAGVYMIARLYFIFALAPQVLLLIAAIGALTAFLAGTIGLVQNDIKKVLAYSTVSQLGYMMLALGVGAPGAAVFHLFTHAFFKACLFLGAGSVIHALHHEQDIRHMGGLFRRMPWTALTFTVSTLAIAGIPPFSGFFSKDEILWETLLHGHPILFGIALAGAATTAFYMFRLTALVFFGKSRAHEHPGHAVHESPGSMVVPLVLLALFALSAGWLGVPESLGGHNYFHHWLNPPNLTPPLPLSIETEHRVTLLSTLVALLVSAFSFFVYTRKPTWPKLWALRGRLIYRMLGAKYAVDEFYDWSVVRPLRFLSDRVILKIVDLTLIDRVLVGAGPFASRLGSGVLSLLQRGTLTTAMLYMLFGTLLVMGIFWKG